MNVSQKRLNLSQLSWSLELFVFFSFFKSFIHESILFQSRLFVRRLVERGSVCRAAASADSIFRPPDDR